jgi:COMPASS component SWD3
VSNIFIAIRASKPSPKKYLTKTTFQLGSEEERKEIFCAEFEHEDKFLAVGVGDGTLYIYNLISGKLAQTIPYQNTETNEMARLMSIKWRRMSYTSDVGSVRKQSMIMCAYSDGIINEYISPVGKLNSTFNENNQTFVLDVDPIEEKFCTAGKDHVVRVYDINTKELIMKMISIDSKEPGHAQRVFAMKYKEDDPNIVITGGWDKTLQIHDIRKGGPVGYIFGPDLSSNAIDIHDNTIVTGSHRGKNPLQTYDLRKKELIQTLEWDYSGDVSESSYIN